MAQNFATGEWGLVQAASNGSSIVTTQKHSGTSSYTVSSGSTSNYGSFSLAGTSSPAVRAYVYVTSVTPGLYNNHLFYITDNSSQAKIGFKISGGGFLTLTTGSTNAALTTLNTSAITFPTNTWVRLELRTSGANSYAAAWFLGDSGTPQDSWSGTAAATINGASYYTFGAPYNMGGYAAPGYWDDMASNSVSDLIGPATAILTNNFETLTNGQTLDTPPTGGNGNTALSGYNGSFGGVATNLYSNTGTISLRQPIGTTNSWSMTNVQTNTVSARGYFMFQSPVANTDLMFMALTANGSPALTVALSIAGSYQQDGFVLLGGTFQNNPLQYTSQGFINSYLNQWLRVELAYTYSTGAYYWGIFLGDSTTALYSFTGTNTTNMPASAANRVDIGKLQTNGASGTVTNYWVDDVALTTASANPIGPPVVATTNITSTQASAWAVATKITPRTQAAAWAVTGAVNPIISSTWNVTGKVLVTSGSSWNTLVNTARQQDVNWNYAGQIVSTQTISWGSAGTVSSTQASTYTVNTGTSKSQASSWTVNTSVVSTQTSTYNLASTLNSAKTSTWAVYTPVVSSQTSTYQVATSVSSSQSSTYTVNIGVQSTLDSRFDTRTIVASTQDIGWTNTVSVTSTQAATYSIGQSIVATQSTLWSLRTISVAQVVGTWNVSNINNQPVGSSIPSTWAVQARAVAVAPASWNVLRSMSMTGTTQWSIRTSVLPVSVTSTWVTAGVFNSSIDSTWNSRRLVRKHKHSTWRVLGPVTVYPITGTIGDTDTQVFVPANKVTATLDKQSVVVTLPQTVRIGGLQ